jgi:hypothetical protein
MKTDTPRTDEEWAAWPYAGPGISVHFGRELERELTAVTEQRDRLTKSIEPLKYWRDISECDCRNPLPQGGCLRCDLDRILNNQ